MNEWRFPPVFLPGNISTGTAVSCDKPINDGGPAFPMPPVGTGDPRDGMTSGSNGISIRDYFAAAALQGLMASRNFLDEYDGPYVYAIADAVLKAREGK
jgi:hypothetical protein